MSQESKKADARNLRCAGKSNGGTGRCRTKKTNILVMERESACDRCECKIEATEGARLHGRRTTCLRCAGLAGLKFLPSGNLSLTKLAIKHAPVAGIVFRHPVEAPRQAARRIGVLVPPAAIAKARTEAARTKAKRDLSLHLPGLEQQGRVNRREEALAA